MNQLQALQHPVSEFVFMEGNKVVTDSLTISQMFGKRHDHVMRDIEIQIEKLLEAGEQQWGITNFGETQYQHPQNKQWYDKYNLTEDAFAIVAMSYITPEAMKMKIKFLQEFKRMKEHIQKLQQQPKSVEDAIIYSMTELKQIKSRQDHTEEEMLKMKLLVDNELWLTEQHKGAVQRKVKQRVFELKKEGYDNASYQGIYGALKRHFGVAKYDKIPRKYYQNAMRFIAGWYPPERPNALDDYVS
ncbi:Rha family transcriptional regulator [Bacillus thuringiensis]|uniref:ORF6C domain-containing protein n=1 Tax=Bacillus cereus group TaxID=86661 RepID=UPI000B43FC0D|nr:MULTISPECIES: ORF6C domain-containing protein [Bacillus cereus group]OTX80690.1 Rha family transcriptional regulator [Bacillus thuringiensis serovar chanpaisis]MED3036624.1 ORF6C domain-containing protein [Bacillus tropicus]PNK23215.1 Rha family transcriptional regulator [Bacillus thuringiensis]PNK23235.1 Rha family transcriptional regulator [Bacillus thuringiensis]PNK31279.1 Rha family transcriptional regulator [Bacillus thuringiensis]